MKIRLSLVVALGLFTLGASAHASVLYGSTSAGGAGELWIIDPATGAAVQDVGPLTDSTATNYGVTGLAFDPINGLLYASTGGKSGASLLIINPATAQVTVVGSYNTAAGATMADIAFDSAGALYGISSSGGANLYSIDIATGQATKIGSSGVSSTSGGGLAISPSGVFYSTPITNDFGTINPTTGVFTFVTNPAKPAGSSASYASLAFDGNTLYGMDLGSPTHLVTISPSGTVTDIGSSVSNIDGIAFSVPEPTSALLLAAAFPLLRTTRRNSR